MSSEWCDWFLLNRNSRWGGKSIVIIIILCVFNCQSEFDGLSVDHGTEGLAVLDRFLTLPMEEILFAADLNWEEIGLFEGLHELLLMLELLHVANLAIEGVSDARCHCHGASVFV